MNGTKGTTSTTNRQDHHLLQPRDPMTEEISMAQVQGIRNRHAGGSRRLPTLASCRLPMIALAALALSLAVSGSAPLPASGQSGGDGFLFKPPVLTLGVRVGVHVPRARGDLFDHTIGFLTLDREDFTGGFLGLDAGIRVNERVDVVIGLDLSGAESRSEFREWVDQDDNPIEQVTEYTTAAITIGAKAYLFDRGRRLSRFAWVPRSANFYMGGGFGYAWYQWDQDGDWVDFSTYDIFYERFVSKGGGLAGHAAAGFDLGISSRFALNAEAKYRLGWGELNQWVFSGFDDGMDLSGLGVAVGISMKF